MSNAAAIASPNAPPEGAWQRAKPCIETLAGCFEAGVMLLDGSGRVTFCSEWMASILEADRATVEGMSSEQLLDHVGLMVADPPPMVRDRQLLATDDRIVCEEFEIPGPPRSVVRWVARRLTEPEPAVVVTCTDITAEVDLASMRERDAITDRLTGMLNRRGIEPQIAREIALASRHGTPLSVLLLDVDHFKRINDKHGHNVGDQVLRATGQAIIKAIRGSDIGGRWGGEEFIVLLPQTDIEQARRAGDRIRYGVEAIRMPEVSHVTISGGVARFEHPESWSNVIDRADKQLYLAKSGGRNRIC